MEDRLVLCCTVLNNSQAFSIGIGALSIGTSIYVTNSKQFGIIILPIRALFIVLLNYGIGMIVYGAIGKLSLN
jgi:hypothetical protein